jgi:hypothetical protein
MEKSARWGWWVRGILKAGNMKNHKTIKKTMGRSNP